MTLESIWRFKPYETKDEDNASISIDDQIKIEEYDLENIRNEYQVQKNFVLASFLALFIPLTLYLVAPYFLLQTPRTLENFLIVTILLLTGLVFPLFIVSIFAYIAIDIPFDKKMDKKMEKIRTLMKKRKKEPK